MCSIVSRYFKKFQADIRGISLPSEFNFPFVIDTHPLCEIAIEELQNYLSTTQDFTHDFGILQPTLQSIGKMFGVLVVQKDNGEVGYLCAFSGKLAGSNHISFFVPPVYDMLQKDGFFLEEEQVLNGINAQIEAIEKDKEYQKILREIEEIFAERDRRIIEKKSQNKQQKRERKQIRESKKSILSVQEYSNLEQDLVKQSLRDKHELNQLELSFCEKIKNKENQKKFFEDQLHTLKKERKTKSNNLQKRLFQSYSFLNAQGKSQSLLDIFFTNLHMLPPAGAGECCAPKLLQFAYKYNLKPLAIAEFWWGASPKSEIKKHKNIYPACWGKCQPILEHMLIGLQVKKNPFLDNPAQDKELEIIYDDPHIVVVNKPAEFLSVPGINIQDSVYQRIKNRYPQATGSIIVHRLDMSTSGLMVLAKSKEIHKHLQNQFIKHTISKKYVALIEGKVHTKKGKVNLPLRVDLNDRPKQLVCYQYGKNAETIYEIIEEKNEISRVHFYPITGRTHQLRVHSAHQNGLNAPIKGDDLYGKISDRLYLHAEELTITHPITKEKQTFVAKAPF